MLLVYYNENYHVFYLVYRQFYDYSKFVGFQNSYGHEVVQILCFHKNEIYNIQDQFEYHRLLSNRKKQKNTIRKRIIRFLNKFDD